jgi:hypothetical protein
MLEVVETCGRRGFGIETAVAELFVPCVHRTIIDDLEARRATTTTLALDFPHGMIPLAADNYDRFRSRTIERWLKQPNPAPPTIFSSRPSSQLALQTGLSKVKWPPSSLSDLTGSMGRNALELLS